MADEKITQKTALTTPAGGDLLYIVDDPGGTPIGKKITLTNLFENVPGTIDLSGITDGNVPYMSASGFADSPLSTDGTNVGIGTTTPSYEIEAYGDEPRIAVVDNSGEGVRLEAGSEGATIIWKDTGTFYFEGRSSLDSGSVSGNGFKTNGSNGNTEFTNGQVFMPSIDSGSKNDLNYDTATGKLVYVSSSKRFKKNIDPLALDTSLIYDLQPRSFNWRDEEGIAEGTKGRRDFGLIAEEVEKVYPELVTYDGEGRPAGVRYKMLTVLLLEEMKNIRKKL